MNAPTDMSQVIIPRSDQLNADDLIAGPLTVTIREVRISPGTEQPVSIVLEGTEKFYRPCKSMSRVLVQAWGPDAARYVGRSLTLYRDPTVKWAGIEVGGIRISHMSDLDGAKQMMLTATKGSRKPFKVLPLVMDRKPAPAGGNDAATNWAGGYIAKLAEFTNIDDLQNFENQKAAKLAELASARPDLHEEVTKALAARKEALHGGSFADDDIAAPSAEGNASANEGTAEAGASSSGSEGQSEPSISTTAATDASPSEDAQNRADAIIAEIKAQNAIMDVNRVITRNELEMAAMPDAIAEAIEGAAQARRDEIRKEQERARAAEAAE